MSFDAVESCLGHIISEGQAELQTGPFGTMLKADEYSSEGAPVISVGEIREGFLEIGSKTPRVSDETIARLPRFLLRANDIVFGRKGSTHRNALIKECEEGYFLGSDGIRLRVRSDSVCPKYLSYQLRSSRAASWLKANSEGTTMPSLNQDILSRFPITLLPITDQKAIAHILGTLDDKIELNRKTNETLEAMAKALFKSWFVDFDPVRAKAEGRPTGLPDEISDLFPDSFEDSELGEIPSGWGCCSFTKLIDVISGGTPKTSISDYWDGTISWFSVVDAPTDSDCWVIRTEKSITALGLDSCSSKLLSTGTTIISARGTVGKVCLTGQDMAMNQSCYGLRSKSENGDYFCFYLTKSLVEILEARAHGSVFSTITRDTLDGVTTISPGQEVILAFNAIAKSLLERIRGNLIESQILSSQRDALLPKLISGEIRIPDAEKLVSDLPR